MSNCKTKKLLVLLTIYSVLSMAGCGQDNKNAPEPTTLPQVTNAPEHTATPVPTEEPTPTPTIVPGEEWKSNLGTIDLSNLRVSGTGVTVNGTTIRITSGGDFTITGTLAEGKIVISTTDRVKLRLSGASLTCSNDSAIFVEQADKAFITVSDGTTNTISSEGTEEAGEGGERRHAFADGL